MFYDLPPKCFSESVHLAQPDVNAKEISPAQAKKVIETRASQVIAALKTSSLSKLAALVHPIKGVRFSPYSFIEDDHLTFKSTELNALAKSRKKRIWGIEDGSGNLIKLNFAEYRKKFVYDKDFAAAPKIGFNEIIQSGNTSVNIAEIYANAIFVEYHFPGTKQSDELDWRSLRLVFQQHKGVWFLVGITHDQWTI